MKSELEVVSCEIWTIVKKWLPNFSMVMTENSYNSLSRKLFELVEFQVWDN